ncbi:nitronate monooxygenase family protein [Aquabacterium sp. NJ1]|uniref:NAD(P)H-dependent flavin oxidoreductase n=1 Tax=Aquabacterium sp. NJ1 TaxID=1538295 RepID=UPI00068D2035|nr:nitronate monooxygenase [Aquabacterium sp. NJ1]
MDLIETLGMALPIIQAPMAGAQGRALAIAVSEAGGLGSLPCAMLSPDMLERELAAIRHATNKPFNVNFFCHEPPQAEDSVEARWRELLAPYYREFGLPVETPGSGASRAPFSHDIADVVEPFRPAVVSFHFGLPSQDLLARVKSWGAMVLSSATTVEEALWLEHHGADAIIAQGLEAGGHRGMFLDDDLSKQMGTFALLPQVVQAVNVPVIAAGGIATPEGVVAALTLGACAVQVGTAYLLSHEATTSPVHRKAIESSASRHTALTNLFSGRPARGIVNRFMSEQGLLSRYVPPFPLASGALAPLRTAAEVRNDCSFSPLWCGQNAVGCRKSGAAEITHWLAVAANLHTTQAAMNAPTIALS